MNDYRININYARALISLAEERGEADRVADDMRLVSDVCRENRELAVVFANPTIPQGRKLAVVEDLFGGHICDATKVFLAFVVKKNRAVNLRGISEAYLGLWRELRGIVYSDLVTQEPIDSVARSMVVQMVSDYTGRTVELHDHTDPRMLGGFKLEFDNKMYDARIQTKIRKLRIAFAKNDYESKL